MNIPTAHHFATVPLVKALCFIFKAQNKFELNNLKSNTGCENNQSNVTNYCSQSLPSSPLDIL